MGEAERYGTYKAQNTGTLNPYAMGNVPGKQTDPTTTQPSSNAAVPMGNSMDNNPAVWDFGGRGSTGTPKAPTGGASDNWSRTPGYGIYERADGKMAGSGGDEVNDQVDFDWDAYLKSLEGLYQGEQDGPQVTIGGEGQKRFTGYDENGASAFDNVGGGGGGSSGGGVVYQGPVFDYPELNRSEPFEYGASLDLPDYEAPEYDEAHERAIREEFIQTNKGALSKSAQQAILGSANVNNPQARGQIIKAALEGFGEALGQTTLKGSGEGRRSAEGKHRREVGIYNAQFDVASKEAVAEYDQGMREDLMNWEYENSMDQQEFQIGMNNWNRMPNDLRAQNMPR
jgi:hypothetical protein